MANIVNVTTSAVKDLMKCCALIMENVNVVSVHATLDGVVRHVNVQRIIQPAGIMMMFFAQKEGPVIVGNVFVQKKATQENIVSYVQ